MALYNLPPTLTLLQEAIRHQRVSPKEALDAQRACMRAGDARFHALVEELAPADPGTGPLAGIGLAHKDIFDTAGRRPGAGHDAGAADASRTAATVIARLQAAGASQLATLAMAEFACGATGDNPGFPDCINPLHPDAAVGGSSSGSAVAVASGMVYAALGTDTAGSVRIPAATCALLGLKTTHGLVSTDGVVPLAPSLDSVGILARSASDALQLLEVIAEPDLLRPTANRAFHIAAWFPEEGLHADVAATLEQFAAESGASDRLPTWPSLPDLGKLNEIVLHTEAAATHRVALLDGSVSPSVEAVALPGLVIPRDWYDASLADRARQLRLFVSDQLGDHDLLLLPALPQPVPDRDTVTPGRPGFDVRQLLALHRHMGFVNYLGCPSMVIPVARDARGLPISVQVLARPFHERDLLAFAAQVETRLFGASAADGSSSFTAHFSEHLQKAS
ncbi:MAG: amidase [Comamonadaceae bacterium]|nr:MAG: amidase [Comamonadaceae bacterium]